MAASQLRQSNLDRLARDTFDVLIVGGGINGAVCAAALAAQGAEVALIEQRDFAGFTSQESSNLAWGGIKYLQSYEFTLVRTLCLSRNQLLQSYPSRIEEIRFLATVARGFRYSPRLLWLGAWLYWLLGNGATRPPRLLSRRRIQREEPLIEVRESRGGIEYSDAYLRDNDARFVFQFIRDALDRGAAAANYVQSLGARRSGGFWLTRARGDGGEFILRSRILINAAGPFVDAHNRLSGQITRHRHVFSKGIHLIVDRLAPRDRVLTFFADDGRLFFVIPLGGRTCIGTTDTRVDDPLAQVSEEDRRFVLDNINKRLRLTPPLTGRDIIAERCGVRPLVVEDQAQGRVRDWLQLSRRHVLEVNRRDAHISIFGGKLTDCINIGNEICRHVQALGVRLPYPGYRWYGEPPPAVKAEYLRQAGLMALDRYTPAGAAETLTPRLWRRYGRDALALLAAIRADPAQAAMPIPGTGYLRCEFHHARDREMIVKLEDFLRRRSAIALTMRREAIEQAPGLDEACEILFGPEAPAKIVEYFGDPAARQRQVS